jgi:hypothetical protein
MGCLPGASSGVSGARVVRHQRHGDRMKALTITGPSVARVTQIDEPKPAHDEVLIRVRKVGLCGSDLNTFLGKNPMVTYPAYSVTRWRAQSRSSAVRSRATFG